MGRGDQDFPDSVDVFGRYILLTPDLFEKEWGIEWTTLRTALSHTRLDYSGEQYNLESLTGEPAMGLLNAGIHQDKIEVLNVSKNQLTDISCLNHRLNGRIVFSSLTVLNASRNMLTDVQLEMTNLAMLNLSNNELVSLPSLSSLRELQRLILAKNKIDGSLQPLEFNTKLSFLDISSNQFSWKPSVFRDQLNVLERIHMHGLILWPNPFAEHFREYQFLTVTALDSLSALDGHEIDSELRNELRKEADDMRRKGVDYSIFDIKVEERKRINVLADDTGTAITGTTVPRLKEMTDRLAFMLDNPNKLHEHVNSFSEMVQSIWSAHYHDRKQLMEVSRTAAEIESGAAPIRSMTSEEEHQQVGDFVVKMQQALDRYDSVQNKLVMCLVRLLACGNSHLSERCGELVAEWVDASTSELADETRLKEVAYALFRDLRLRALYGMQGITESPFECYEASSGRKGSWKPSWGTPSQIAESACILKALKTFGNAGIAGKPDSPCRAQLLQPFLPALCREPHKKRGEDQPADKWQLYDNFDAFPDEVAEEHEVQGSDLLICFERCARQGYGGFVIEEQADQTGLCTAMFKKHLPDALVGMRRVHPGRKLHVRPTQAAGLQTRPPDGDDHIEAWSAWSHAIQVLDLATTYRANAAVAVSTYGIHEAITLHDSEASTGFTDSWMMVTSEATRAFTAMLQVATNLTRATAPAGHDASQYFMEKKLHTNCWDRVRRRLMENGAQIPVSRLSTQSRDFTMTISALVGTVCAMREGGTEQVADAIMQDLKGSGLDVFSMLLDVAACTAVPDPILLATSFEVIYAFLDSSITQQEVLPKVMNKLHDSATLLPYIKGPLVKDAQNLKYQELWRLCVVKYNSDSSAARERMPELFRTNDEAGEVGAEMGDNKGPRQEERGKWNAYVPEICDLKHPVMHRVLLSIVRLIKLFSLKSASDPSLIMRGVEKNLDDQGREKLLIGPSTGLVTCPNYEIKIECLKVIAHVLETSPAQLSGEEMGWLMQYLNARGMSAGKQEEFLMEVLRLIILLVKNDKPTGELFRQKFAKLAIRESFEMLKVNCHRDVRAGSEEEKEKNAISLVILQFLQVTSRPLSGGLRRFLGRVELLDCVKVVMEVEDKHDRPSFRTHVLGAWTCRNMREVLLPLVTGGTIRPRSMGKYRCLVRMADVLQGRNDYEKSVIDKPKMFIQLPPTNELDIWPSAARMQRALAEHDETEREDWQNQQEQFIDSDGMTALLNLAERYISIHEHLQQYYTRSKALVSSWKTTAEQQLHQWWNVNRVGSASDNADLETLTKQNEQAESAVEFCMLIRLRTIHQRVSDLYKCNLNIFDEKNKVNTLEKLAKLLSAYFIENQRQAKEQYEKCTEYYNLLLHNYPNQYIVVNQLMTIKDAVQTKTHIDKPRQPHGDVKQLVEQAKKAQTVMKKLLVARPPRNTKETDEWARTELDAGKEPTAIRRHVTNGLAKFFNNHGATITDPGWENADAIVRKDKFKYFGDFRRVRNAARLLIEYDDVEKLYKSLKSLQEENRVSISMIRNCFLTPTNLGRRFVSITVEVPLPEGGKHLGELHLVVRGESWKRKKKLLETLEKELQVSCQVQNKISSQVAEYLIYELESRSLRHGDSIFLNCKGRHLEVAQEDVFMEDDILTTGQIFIIEREAKRGVIKSGDVVSLRSKATKKYLDIAHNGHLRCRFDDAESQSSTLKFILEIDLLADSDDGQKAIGFFGGRSQALVPAGQDKQTSIITNVHTKSKIKLRAKGTSQRYITLLPDAGYLGRSNNKQRVKGLVPTDDLAESQLFTVYREGSLQDYLGFREIPDKAKLTVDKSSDEKVGELLLRAHMCADLPTHEQCPSEGGKFRQTPVDFKVVSRRSAEGGSSKQSTDEIASCLFQDEADDAKYLSSEPARAPPLVSAILRCLYVLVEVPVDPDSRNYAIDEMLGGPGAPAMAERMAERLLRLVLSVQLAQPDDMWNDINITTCWVPAKFLRVFSAALLYAPMLCIPARRRPTGRNVQQNPQETKREESGEYDMHRIMFLQMFASYIDRILVHPLLLRLSVVAHRSLELAEVKLIREFVNAIHKIVISFLGNELRCNKDSGGIDGHNRARGGTLALTDGQAKNGDIAGAKNRLPQAVQAKILAALVTPPAIRVLVHAMLYGVHQEAIAFSGGFKQGSEDHVRLTSSLVNRSIAALAAVMDACAVSEETRCEYHVCEAISQAMSLGAQLVPRARITQLMQERGVDSLRTAVQNMMDKGLPLPQDHENLSNFVQTLPTERPVFVALAWAGPVADEDAGNVSRRLIVVTSRLNLLIMGFKPGAARIDEDGGIPPTEEHLQVITCRELRRLQHTIVHPRMRQFLGLWWDETQRPQREVIIFESSSRRRNFQHMLRMVERDRPKTQKQYQREFRRGVPALHVRQPVMEALMQTSRPDVKNDARIVNVTFVKSQKDRVDGYFAAQSQVEVDVLVLTVDSLCVITLSSFLSTYARTDDADYSAEAFAKQADGVYKDDPAQPVMMRHELETDSEGEEDILATSETTRPFENIPWLTRARGDTWELKNLQGVWFLADAQPRVKLQFDRKEQEICFTRDGERQRWRRHLFTVLHSQERRSKSSDQGKSNQGWSVVPTAKQQIDEVKKQAQAKQRQLIQERPVLADALVTRI